MFRTHRERTETKLRLHISNLQEQIAQRDASQQRPVLQRKIDGLKVGVKEQGEELEEKNKKLSELVEKITELENQIEEQSDQIAGLEELIAAQGKVLNKKEQE